jgi:hypothetical protein
MNQAAVFLPVLLGWRATPLLFVKCCVTWTSWTVGGKANGRWHIGNLRLEMGSTSPRPPMNLFWSATRPRPLQRTITAAVLAKIKLLATLKVAAPEDGRAPVQRFMRGYELRALLACRVAAGHRPAVRLKKSYSHGQPMSNPLCHASTMKIKMHDGTGRTNEPPRLSLQAARCELGQLALRFWQRGHGPTGGFSS